jgi:hypothetical protein
VTVSSKEGIPHGNADLIGLGLPCTKTNSGDLGAGVEGVSLSVEIMVNAELSLMQAAAGG